jgi:hypothetical protein
MLDVQMWAEVGWWGGRFASQACQSEHPLIMDALACTGPGVQIAQTRLAGASAFTSSHSS